MMDGTALMNGAIEAGFVLACLLPVWLVMRTGRQGQPLSAVPGQDRRVLRAGAGRLALGGACCIGAILIGIWRAPGFVAWYGVMNLTVFASQTIMPVIIGLGIGLATGPLGRRRYLAWLLPLGTVAIVGFMMALAGEPLATLAALILYAALVLCLTRRLQDAGLSPMLALLCLILGPNLILFVLAGFPPTRPVSGTVPDSPPDP